MWIKKHKNKLIILLVMVLSLVIAYNCGSDIKEKDVLIISDNTDTSLDLNIQPSGEVTDYKNDETEEIANDNETSLEDSSLLEKEEKLPGNDAENILQSHTVTISVRCDTILNNIDKLVEEKRDIVPADGVILSERQVEFYDGESVFNVLYRVLKENKIHVEFSDNKLYSSVYIEGIANLYEFDCGELSGWMYKVNGTTPNYGCSRYKVKSNDVIEWVYTCDLGLDVNGREFERNG